MFSGSATWSSTQVTYTKSATVNVRGESFEAGKDEYHLTIKVYDGDITQTVTHYFTTTNEGLPSVLMHGTSLGNFFFFEQNGRGGFQFHIDLATNTRLSRTVRSNVTYLQISSGSVWCQFNDPPETQHFNVDIEADFPIFGYGHITTETPNQYVTIHNVVFDLSTSNDYRAEIAAGNYTHLSSSINYTNEVDSIPANKVWDIINYLKVDGTITQTKAYCFKILPDAKIAFYVTNQVNGDGSPNMVLRISEYPCLVKNFYAPDSAYTEASSIDSSYWWGEWQDYGSGTAYNGYGATNIPIFESESDVNKYFAGQLGIEDAINGGDSAIQSSTIGDPLSSSDVPSINLAISGSGCNIYALSEAELKDIMQNYLYTTAQALQDEIKESLWTWGNSPIEFMIDCYYIPFGISSFYDTITANLKFGTHQFTGTSFDVIKETNGNRLTLFNTTFEGVYGDWRDYTQFDYDLFLPFVGFISLDVFKYLNHKVKCEMMFDITTHNIRYYLYVDEILTDRIDGSVGINVPLMATDTVNKAKGDREAYNATKNMVANGALTVATGFAGALSGNPFMVAGAVSNITGMVGTFSSIADKYAQEAKEKTYGSFSSAMNVYDINYAYVRITERQVILPSRLNPTYNYPSYYIGPLSALTGYCELSDVQLVTNATESEYNEIKNLLKEGVIF